MMAIGLAKHKGASLPGGQLFRFCTAWKGKVDMAWFPALKPAVLHLYAKARPGDCMLLSPATASFDLYKGMAYRGQDFKDIVGGLG